MAFVPLNTMAGVDHGAQLSDATHLSRCSSAGEVRVGARSLDRRFDGSRRVSIGSDVTVGAGAAVVSDLPDGVTAVGVLARAVSSN